MDQTTQTPAFFIADAPGLDFLNSLATPVDEPVDWLRDGRAFIDWLRQAQLVPEDELVRIVERTRPGELDAVATEARKLREWFRDFVRRHMGKPLGPNAIAELGPINRLLERDEVYGRIVARLDGNPTYETTRRWRSAESLLFPLAEAMASVIAHEDFSHVKACEGHNCTLLFVDRTRARARRWCSMGVCGNRAKVSAHRQRKRSAETQ